MIWFRAITLGIFYAYGIAFARIFGEPLLAEILAARSDLAIELARLKFRRRWIMKTWKTTIGEGVIGSTDTYAWCHHKWRRPDSNVIPAVVLIDAMADAAVEIRTNATTSTGEKPETIATTSAVITANRVVKIGCTFTITDVADEPGRVWVTSNLTNREVASLDLASRCFLN